MKASELINALQELVSEHGDLDVAIFVPHDYDDSADDEPCIDTYYSDEPVYKIHYTEDLYEYKQGFRIN